MPSTQSTKRHNKSWEATANAAPPLIVGGNKKMKYKKYALVVIGVLLILNGVANIIDDSRILTYDITSIIAGIGFIIVSKE